MKLQINSLEALERLIGGDTEVEIEIRNNIVQSFAKKHLKAIANDTVFAKVSHDVRTASETVAREQTTQAFNKLGMFTGQAWNRTFILLPEIKDALRDTALTEVNTSIKEAVAVAVATYDADLIKKRINRLVDEHIQNKISEGVKKKLNEITNKVLS